MENKKIVIYFGGGTMSGVFGAGVASVLQEKNIYSQVEAVYATSAGILTGAYFLAEQVPLGSRAYWEDLNEGFISIPDFWMGTWQRFQSHFLLRVPQEKLRDAINVDYVIDVVSKKKSLDIKKIISQPIPLYVKLFNLDTKKIEYVDARRPDILEIFKAGISVFPYVHKWVEIDGCRYIDAASMDIIGLEYLLSQHPESNIIISLNSPTERKFRFKAKNFLEGKFTSWMFKDKSVFQPYMLAETKVKKDLVLIKNNPKITLIAPSPENYIPSRAVSPTVMKNTWKLGVCAGEVALSKLLGL